jgi:serine-type D-Ala-D-Ala carboxypeptidase/endopeptidase (penicillin-binding protein 4)
VTRTVPAALVAAGTLALLAGSAHAGPAATVLDRFAGQNPGVSAVIWRLDDDGPQVVASIRPHAPRIPASNMKMVTAAGALVQLGPDWRFTTRLATSATAEIRADGRLVGPLYLLGGGDPLLSTRAYGARYLPSRATPLSDLAVPLRRAGIRSVTGPLIADESLFDRMRMGPAWFSHYSAYSQPLSALAVNQNFAGNARRLNVGEPWRAAAVRMRQALGGARVAHTGPLRRGVSPPGVQVLATASSAPLSGVVREMNVPSDNFIAEMVVKAVGANAGGAGTTAAGNARTHETLRGLGVLTPRDRLVDGSGLSRRNRLTAASLARLVAAADADTVWGPAFMASLPRGGEGTLRNRLTAGAVANRVRAKTGFINGASALSGHVVSRGGQRYAFAMLMNTSRISEARAVQDAVVTLLARGREDTPR